MDQNMRLIWLNRTLNVVAMVSGVASGLIGVVALVGDVVKVLQGAGLVPNKWLGVAGILGALGALAAKYAKTPSQAIAAAVPPSKQITPPGGTAALMLLLLSPAIRFFTALVLGACLILSTNDAAAITGQICLNNYNPPWGYFTLPYQAAFPVPPTQVYCQHVPAQGPAPQYWPLEISACTPLPNGSIIPGLHQIDVWVRDGAASMVAYYCARVTVPMFGGYRLDYQALMEMGWFAYVPGDWSGRHMRWIQGIVMGDGTFARFSTYSDAISTSSCTGLYTCQAYGTPVGGLHPWIQVDSFLTQSLYFLRF